MNSDHKTRNRRRAITLHLASALLLATGCVVDSEPEEALGQARDAAEAIKGTLWERAIGCEPAGIVTHTICLPEGIDGHDLVYWDDQECGDYWNSHPGRARHVLWAQDLGILCLIELPPPVWLIDEEEEEEENPADEPDAGSSFLADSATGGASADGGGGSGASGSPGGSGGSPGGGGAGGSYL